MGCMGLVGAVRRWKALFQESIFTITSSMITKAAQVVMPFLKFMLLALCLSMIMFFGMLEVLLWEVGIIYGILLIEVFQTGIKKGMGAFCDT
jgi:hypothetical protein